MPRARIRVAPVAQATYPELTCRGGARCRVGGERNGRKVPTSGEWAFEQLSKDSFRLRIFYSDQPSGQGIFKIFDQDHIQNIDLNDVALRVK